MKIPFLLLLLLCAVPTLTLAKPIKIIVLGDSLTAGYGLDQASAFPARLEAELLRQGYRVEVGNAGISGDTSAGGLARLDWTLDSPPDLMIIELGANDALRGLNPQQTKQNLSAIISRLKAVGVQPLLTGMKAPRNMGEDYYTKFDRLYVELAREHQIPLYPFFLAGIAGDPTFNQADGIHPTANGVEVIVRGIVPLVKELLEEMVENNQR